MYTHLNTEMMNWRIDLLRKLHFALPQNYPAVQTVQGFEVRLLHAHLYTLLDLVVVDVQVEVQVSYVGIDHSLHILTEIISDLQTMEKPAGKVLNLQCAGMEMRQDHQLILPQPTQQLRVRQFEALLLVRLLYHVSYARERSSFPGDCKRHNSCGLPDGSSHRTLFGRRDYQSPTSWREAKREGTYPWKRVHYTGEYR